MEEWDLQAVVSGYSDDFSTSLMLDSLNCFDSLMSQQEGLLGFPDFFESTTIWDELEEVYKPFYPVPCEVEEKQKLLTDLSGSDVAASTATSTTTPQATRTKKSRKNQNKKVVQQVSSNGLSSDMWAWRKYGQKPIKGSPYPRSYYRCSSSKGCLARKQVERSRSEPGTFIITYTADHNHSHPTRRSTLAGITRKKPSESKTRKAALDADGPIIDSSSCSSVTTAVLSPTTPLMATVEDEKNTEEEERVVEEISEHDQFLFGMDYLDRLSSDLAFDDFVLDRFPAAFSHS